MNVFVLLRIESERMYKMLWFTIEFINRRSQDLIIIRERIFDLIRKRKLMIWEIYHFFMQLVSEFDEIVFLIDHHISNIREKIMKMLHLYELLFNRTCEFNVIFKWIFEIYKWNTSILNDFFYVFIVQFQMQIHWNEFVFQFQNVD
jgi:hypothetical protein